MALTVRVKTLQEENAGLAQALAERQGPRTGEDPELGKLRRALEKASRELAGKQRECNSLEEARVGLQRQL
jgi:hypothetical protein